MSKYSPCLLSLVDYSHPLLRQVITPVKFPLSPEDQHTIMDMQYSILPEQLRRAKAPWDSAAGMAANQWGINKRIFLFAISTTPFQTYEVAINPSYEPIYHFAEANTHDLVWEGCFSVPAAQGNISRYIHIKATYQNAEGKTITRELSGHDARIFQHETDHLNGLLYDDPTAGKCIEKRNC